MWKNYIKIAWRNLRRNSVFSLINIGGLSLGLACCMLILLYVKDEASFDRFHENLAQLHRVKVTMTNGDGQTTIGSTNAIHGPTFKEEIPEIREVVRAQSSSFVVRNGEDVSDLAVLFADRNFFEVFSMPLLNGSPVTVLSDIHNIVLSEDMAERYFNTKDAVGKVLELKIGEEFQPFVVSGVAKRSPWNSSLQFDSIISFDFQEQKGWTDDAWMGFYMNTFLLLDKTAVYGEVVSKLNTVFKNKAASEIRESENFVRDIFFDLQAFEDIHLDSSVESERNGLAHASNPTYSYLLSGISLLILVIACINFVNLTVARSLTRAKEIGIRKASGSQRKQLITQFLTESFLLAFIAYLLAIFLAQLALPTFNELANKHLSIFYLWDGWLLMLYVVLFLLTGLMAGGYPAMVLSGFSPAKTLYNRTQLTQKGHLTKGLVVFQFSLSIVLLIGTIVIYSQFNFLSDKDLGYDDDNLMSFEAIPIGNNTLDIAVIKQQLESSPGIQSVAAFNGNYNGTVAKIDKNTIGFNYIGIDDDFLPALEIPIIEGRNFSQEFGTDPTEAVIINEAFVREAGWSSPIGQEVYFEWKDQTMKVVGVIKDYHFASLREEIEPLLMTKDPNYHLRTLYVKLDGKDIPGTIKEVEQVFRGLVPFQPFHYQFEKETNGTKYEREAKWKQMITVSAITSIFISCIGLFGLATFNTESRVKEIGIRKVLGASTPSLAVLLSVDFVKLVLVGIALALPLAIYAANTWLNEFPYRIEVPWWYFALAGGVALIVALFTVSMQVLKAALANPVKSLRSE